jgi:hypothetical protein
MHDLERLEKKIDDLNEHVRLHTLETVQRVTKLEANQKGFISFFTILITSLGAFITSLF